MGFWAPLWYSYNQELYGMTLLLIWASIVKCLFRARGKLVAWSFGFLGIDFWDFVLLVVRGLSLIHPPLG